MKKFFYTAAICAVSMAITSCDSDVLTAGEELENLKVVAEKPVVDVENFDEVDVSTSDNQTMTYKTSDGNVIKGNVVGLKAKGVYFTYDNETAESRTVNVRFVAENSNGVQRVATTSYQQRKPAEVPVAPVEVVSVRLVADTTMYYSGSCVQMLLKVDRIYTYSDKHEETVPVISRAAFTVLDMPNNEIGTYFITNGDAVENVVFWNGCTRTVRQEKTYEKSQCIVNEKAETLSYNILATSDANQKCDISSKSQLVTRNIKFTDDETNTTLEYTFNFTPEFVGVEVENRNLSSYSNTNGSFKYDGTYLVKFNHQLNGKTYTQRTVKTDIYSK